MKNSNKKGIVTEKEFLLSKNGHEVKKMLKKITETDRIFHVQIDTTKAWGNYFVVYKTFLGGNGSTMVAVKKEDAVGHSEMKTYRGDLEDIYLEFSSHEPQV